MANRLRDATSPYLRQHQDNPVDWYPWGDTPFRIAAERNVPVFISIGYAACHWCHVMAHESFEHPEVGALLNESFVSVKVDREEHPTVDHFYMSATTAMGRRGGWPLTILATPDRKPFYAATYLPRRSRSGRLGLVELLSRVSSMWSEQPDEIRGFGAELTRLLEEAEKDVNTVFLSPEDLSTARDRLHDLFDEAYGGFGSAPKFPTAHHLLFLFRIAVRFDDARSLAMATKTLTAISSGGIFDHVGGGAHRYATDREWKLPHFEKMLIDQAMLLVAYAQAYQLTGNRGFADTAEAIAAYVLRDLRNADGSFYTSEDADSEGAEGLFYLWSYEELTKLLSPTELDHLRKYWHVASAGNVNDEATGEPTGKNILYGSVPPDDADAQHVWQRVQSILAEARETRERPMRDEKVLTDWNGAMIAALAYAGRVMKNANWILCAGEAATHMLSDSRKVDGRPVHSSFEGRISVSGFLEDYAYLVWGCLELFQSSAESRWLEAARDLSREQVERFWDTDRGGFYLEAAAEQQIPVRQKTYSDAAYPAGGSIAAGNLLKLNYLLDEPEFEQVARQQLEQAVSSASGFQTGFSSALSFVDLALGPVTEIVIVSGSGSPALSDIVDATYLPNSVTVKISDGNREEITSLMPHLHAFETVNGKETVYICVDRTCDMPVTAKEKLETMLRR